MPFGFMTKKPGKPRPLPGTDIPRQGVGGQGALADQSEQSGNERQCILVEKDHGEQNRREVESEFAVYAFETGVDFTQLSVQVYNFVLER